VKLLFDQNISFRVISRIQHNFNQAQQVRQLALENASDTTIWQYAKDNDYTIVTFDSDFFDLCSIKGHPPKIIWLRLGNTSTNYIAEIINQKAEIISDFIEKPEYESIACLEIR
tara:strand:+ start:7057 stop:7398 length:342 start_codon:yes stop_codon:yes gene_type:complete